VIATMDLPNDAIPQYLMETDSPMHQVQASFDMMDPLSQWRQQHLPKCCHTCLMRNLFQFVHLYLMRIPIRGLKQVIGKMGESYQITFKNLLFCQSVALEEGIYTSHL
jgi:hypothetical protein